MVLLTKLCESVIKTLPENNSSNSSDYSENNLRLLFVKEVKLHENDHIKYLKMLNDG